MLGGFVAVQTSPSALDGKDVGVERDRAGIDDLAVHGASFGVRAWRPVGDGRVGGRR
jgi:hypothetical protein